MREKPNQVVSDSGQLSVENAAPPTADREVPTISITSDTAYGAGEAYTILDGSIAHIQRLQQTIQRMRQIQPSFYDPAAPGRSDWSSTKRNSTSCPSLATEHTSLGTGLDITEIDLDITNCQRDFLLNNNRFGDVNYGIGEIRDGAAGTRRSHSLSNSESELEETFPPPGIPLLSSGSPSRTAGDFDEIDVGSHRSFNSNIPPSLAHRSNRGKGGKQGVIHHASFVSPQGGGPIPMHAGRTFPVNRNLNLAMHKSISTPSIHHAPPEGRYRSTTGIHPGQPLVPNAPLAGESGSDSDGDEPATLKGFSRQVGPLAPGIGLNLQGQQFTRDSSLSEESVGKRRKRSSIFFKKKKEKERGLLCNSGSRPPDLRKPSGHAFRVIYSSKEICDSCQRPLFGNIRSPLQCQSCSATVHEACRDDVLLECNGGVAWHPPTTKSKSLPKTPSSHHVGGGAGLKQSSTPGFGLRSVHSSSGSLFGRKTLGGHSLSSASMSTLTTSSWGMNSRETTRLMDDFETNSEETIEETYARFFGEGAVETNIDDAHPDLGVLSSEVEAWSKAVDRSIVESLTDVEVKRQEHIYEFLMTEKHHCVTLQLMDKLFGAGMIKCLNYPTQIVEEFFPCLDQLILWHTQFLRKLRERQSEGAVVGTIRDILLDQFTGIKGQELEKAYGMFCSHHKRALSLYKEHMRKPGFAALARKWADHPLCEKKGIPECVLFVTQRVTKYPLLIDPLIKTARLLKDDDEREALQELQIRVRNLLININTHVAVKEKAVRLGEIYEKFDTRSSAIYLGQKFKKTDLEERTLVFEGMGSLSTTRGKQIEVIFIVMNDVAFFLTETNGKFAFYTSEVPVVSLQQVIVREKAEDKRALFLIFDNAEMLELICIAPKTRKLWVDAIRQAVSQCTSTDSPVSAGEVVGGSGGSLANVEAWSRNVEDTLDAMNECDVRLQSLLEEKISQFQSTYQSLYGEDVPAVSLPKTPTYALTAETKVDSPYPAMRNQMSEAWQTIQRVATALNLTGLGSLSRSASSVGEHQSPTFDSPALPKRAETFAEFDRAAKESLASFKPSTVPKSKAHSSSNASMSRIGSHHLSFEVAAPETPDGLSDSRLSLAGSSVPSLKELQSQTIQLTQIVATLHGIVEQHCTGHERMRAEMLAAQEYAIRAAAGSGGGKSSFHGRLEELRNLQDRITEEKREFEREKKSREEEVRAKESRLEELQTQLDQKQKDISEQRELLYRRVECLKAQGIVLNSNFQIVSISPPLQQQIGGEGGSTLLTYSGSDSSTSLNSPQHHGETLSNPHSPTTSVTEQMKRVKVTSVTSLTSLSSGVPKGATTAAGGSSSVDLPQHLVSTTNQSKAQNIQIKQQLPLKLAKPSSKDFTKASSTSPGGSPSGTLTSPLGQGSSPQVLPMKLREDKAKGQVASFSYQKFDTAPASLGSALRHNRFQTPTSFHNQSFQHPTRTDPEPPALHSRPNAPPEAPHRSKASPSSLQLSRSDPGAKPNPPPTKPPPPKSGGYDPGEIFF